MDTIIAFIAALMINSSYVHADNLNRAELYCLSKAVYHESRGEPIEGQVAVAHVVLNRVNSDSYPSSVCGVVYEPHQFTDIGKTRPNYQSKEWTTAVEVAILSKIGFLEDPTNGAKWYYAHKKIKKPSWAKKKIMVAQIGGHTFLNTAG